MKKKVSIKHKEQVRFAPLVPTPVAMGLKAAEHFVEQGEGLLALNKLTEMENKYPGHRPVLETMLAGALALEDTERLIIALEGLQRLSPDDTAALGPLILAYRTAGYPSLTVEAARAYTKVVDADELMALPISDGIAELEANIRRRLDEEGIGGDDEGFELSIMLERARLRLDQGRFADSRTLSEEVLTRRPGFVLALNTIARTYYFEGNIVEAIAVTERTLAGAPEDIDTIALAAKYYLLAGQTETANRMGDRLKTSPSKKPGRTFKLTEALSYLGDDEGVLEAFYEEYPKPRPHVWIWPKTNDVQPDGDVDEVGALMHLYAGVAECRLGHEDEAVKLWKKALDLDPDLTTAEDNLDDLDLPIEERNGPCGFPLFNWVPQPILDELILVMDPLLKARPNMKAEEAVVSRLLERYPMLETSAAPMLDRGDPAAKNFVFMLSMLSGSPIVHAACRDFALGQRGPDELRMRAAILSVNQGLIPAGMVRMWVKGEWQEVRVG